jgi:hypothetical protein
VLGKDDDLQAFKAWEAEQANKGDCQNADGFVLV